MIRRNELPFFFYKVWPGRLAIRCVDKRASGYRK